jgi:hypothetical protein
MTAFLFQESQKSWGHVFSAQTLFRRHSFLRGAPLAELLAQIPLSSGVVVATT